MSYLGVGNLVGSNGEEIFVIDGPRKKYLARCQILRSKH